MSHIQSDLAAIFLKTIQNYLFAYLNMPQKGSKKQPVKFLDKDSVSMEI